MTSNIDVTKINPTFPTPGIDNDTQGFRDNFSGTKDNFSAAKAEISSLQANSAKLNANNNFDGNSIISAVLQGSGDAVSPQVTIIGNMELPWTEASYYAFTVNGNVTLTMTEWPTPPVTPSNKIGILGKMTVHLTGSTTTRNVLFDTVNGIVKFQNNEDNTISIAAGTTKIYEFWTIDGGAVVYGKLVGNYL